MESKEVMGNNEGSVEETLKQRGSVYGDYSQVCAVRSQIMGILRNHHIRNTGIDMSGVAEMGFNDIVLKLVRAAGAPDYADSFHDLGGYAKLMEDMVNVSNNK